MMDRIKVLQTQLNNVYFLLGRIRGTIKHELDRLERRKKLYTEAEKKLEEHYAEEESLNKQIKVLEEMKKELEP